MTRDALIAAVHDIVEDAAYARAGLHRADDPHALAHEVAERVRDQVATLIARDPIEAPTRTA